MSRVFVDGPAHRWGPLAIVLAAFVVLAACAMVRTEPFIDGAAVPRDDVGYVAASFSVAANTQTFTFVLMDPVGRAYDMAFRELAPPVKKHFDPAVRGNEPVYEAEPSKQLGVVALPPGDYRVAYWRRGLLGAAAQPLEVKRGSPLGKPFAVKPGHVVFLGSFSAADTSRILREDYRSRTIEHRSSITPVSIQADAAWALFTKEYPGFAAAPLECLLCKASGEEEAPSAAPAPRQAGGFTRRPGVVVHLYRRAGETTGCVLHAWESYDDRRGKREVLGASREQPAGPAGKDAFGPYWTLNALDFRNGRVNFAIRGCTPELQRKVEGSWTLADSQEAWVREGDPTIYGSAADAAAAMER